MLPQKVTTMKIVLIALSALALSTGVGMAQTTAGSQSGSYSQSGVNIGGSPMQAPSAIAPGLIASGLSCSGSGSIGAAGGGWGLSLGITKEDKACNAREDAKYIQGVTGSVKAAKARMCMQADNREAFRLAGEPCPQDAAIRSASSAPALRSSQPRVAQTFNSMAACEQFAASNPGFACRKR